MKDIGAHLGYTILWDMSTKVVLARVHVCYYLGAPPRHVMVVLSGTRIVRVLCVWAAALDLGQHVNASGLRLSAHGECLWTLVK